MKPMLDRMVDRVVASLSGEARAFYDREFTFFNEVTDISGKLKPFIKKTKPEKKVRFESSFPLRVSSKSSELTSSFSLSFRLRSTRRWPRSSSMLESTFPVIPMESSSISIRNQVDLFRVTRRSVFFLLVSLEAPRLTLDLLPLLRRLPSWLPSRSERS